MLSGVQNTMRKTENEVGWERNEISWGRERLAPHAAVFSAATFSCCPYPPLSFREKEWNVRHIKPKIYCLAKSHHQNEMYEVSNSELPQGNLTHEQLLEIPTKQHSNGSLLLRSALKKNAFTEYSLRNGITDKTLSAIHAGVQKFSSECPGNSLRGSAGYCSEGQRQRGRKGE